MRHFTNREEEKSVATKDEIKAEAEFLRENMIPKLKVVIQDYVDKKISYEEAKDKVEEIRLEFVSPEDI